ncbi:MAG: hypothetical protein GC150_16405 [Rhizobiales bacterium]|nr:hypothetical protein [Hyphomicrobiales bacterium]
MGDGSERHAGAGAGAVACDPAVERIRGEMERRGWSQRLLADRSLVGESTIFRLLRGQYSRKTLVKVEAVLGLEGPASPGPAQPPGAAATVAGAGGVAATSLGGYSRAIFSHYEGEYRCVRPTFTGTPEVMVYPFSIAWDEGEPGLVFVDRNPGYGQRGVVMVPPGSTLVHFVTLDRGSARLITAYHISFGETDIRGAVLTIANPRGRDLYPAAGPLVLARVLGADDPIGGLAGRVSRNDPRLGRVRAMLDQMTMAPGMLME